MAPRRSRSPSTPTSASSRSLRRRSCPGTPPWEATSSCATTTPCRKISKGSSSGCLNGTGTQCVQSNRVCPCFFTTTPRTSFMASTRLLALEAPISTPQHGKTKSVEANRGFLLRCGSAFASNASLWKRTLSGPYFTITMGLSFVSSFLFPRLWSSWICSWRMNYHESLQVDYPGINRV